MLSFTVESDSPHLLVVNGLLHLDDLVHADVTLGQLVGVGEAVVGEAAELQHGVGGAVELVEQRVARGLGRLGLALRQGDE